MTLKTKIVYLLLCHKDPQQILEQIAVLTAMGDRVVVHFDAKSPQSAYSVLERALQGRTDVRLSAQRARGGWGQWGLVQGTLYALRTGYEAFADASHFYLISADCLPIKSRAQMEAVLDKPLDYIESFDFWDGDWIQSGLREERLFYHHLFNERRQRRLFYASLRLQQRLGLKRKLPQDLEIRIGAQWWCLRRASVGKVLDYCAQNPQVLRFFKTVWIPDEIFFQSLIGHLVSPDEIAGQSLTFFAFHHYGIPLTFYDEHLDMLEGLDACFARKAAQFAPRLRAETAALYRGTRPPSALAPQRFARALQAQKRGRSGLRFAPRAWELSPQESLRHRLWIVAAKDWPRGKDLIAALAPHLNGQAYGYLYNEKDAQLPDLGGLEAEVLPRWRHRIGFLRTVLGVSAAKDVLFGMDPANAELVRDLKEAGFGLRVIELCADPSDAFLTGHAERMGWLGAEEPQETRQEIEADLAREFGHESAQLAQIAGADYLGLAFEASLEEKIAALAKFANLSSDAARDLRLALEEKEAHHGL